MHPEGLISILLALTLAPLLPGVCNRVKAWFAGRQGPPLLQTYYDLRKLWRKGVVYSRTTTGIFRAAPVITLAALVAALALAPFGRQPALLAFPGDLLVLAGLLGLGRFMTVLGALDTGSSFEGMGASREVQFAALAEPAFLLALAVFALKTLSPSLSDISAAISIYDWFQAGPALTLGLAALVVVLLAENARMPVDDPNTHLELTMIHEVMVLDYSGPDFALVLYGAALKLWLFSVLAASLLFPIHTGHIAEDVLVTLAGTLAMGVLVGIVESVMARLRLLLVPQLLAGAAVLAVVALILLTR